MQDPKIIYAQVGLDPETRQLVAKLCALERRSLAAQLGVLVEAGIRTLYPTITEPGGQAVTMDDL